jgi:hypothetical protein
MWIHKFMKFLDNLAIIFTLLIAGCFVWQLLGIDLYSLKLNKDKGYFVFWNSSILNITIFPIDWQLPGNISNNRCLFSI